MIETRVLDTTDNFRSERDVEELWEAVVSRLSIGVDNALQVETDPGAFLQAKEYLTSFMATLEVDLSFPAIYSYALTLCT